MKRQPFASIQEMFPQTGFTLFQFDELKSTLNLPGWMHHALSDEGMLYVEYCGTSRGPLIPTVVLGEWNFFAISLGGLNTLSEVVAYYPIVGKRNETRYQGLWAEISRYETHAYRVLLTYPCEKAMTLREARIFLQDIARALLDSDSPASHLAA